MVRFTSLLVAALSAGVVSAAPPAGCAVPTGLTFPLSVTGNGPFLKKQGSSCVGNGNPNCADMGFDWGYKITTGGEGCQEFGAGTSWTDIGENTAESDSCSAPSGTVETECLSTGNEIQEIKLTSSQDTYVFVKAAVGGTVYKVAAGDEVTLDYLNGGTPRKEISHVEFCFNCDEAPFPSEGTPVTPAPAPTTAAPVTAAPVTAAPVTAAPVTDAPAATPTSTAPDADPQGDGEDPKAFTRGDPHFKTFGGELYDYHGQCDMVLLSNPNFKNGLGMTVHIRTKIQDFWSSVESAAIKIGEDFLEVAGGEGKEWLWVNGEANEVLEEQTWYRTSLAGFLVRFKQTGSVKEANIYLEGAKEVLVIKTYHDFVRVDINWVDSENYGGSVGLLGAKDMEGVRVGRDGTEIKDVNAFGQEWQVKEGEDKLFHNYDATVVQAPAKCALPPSMTDEKIALRKRRLAESDLTEEKAEKACEHVQGASERKACVYDILATQDINMAGAW